jgi:hypothetical protein
MYLGTKAGSSWLVCHGHGHGCAAMDLHPTPRCQLVCCMQQSGTCIKPFHVSWQMAGILFCLY